MIATELRLSGDLGAEGFVDWICHRARLLNLSGWIRRDKDSAVTIVVCGPTPLIDAMEMACSLGPIDVQVDRIDARPTRLEVAPNGFGER